MIEQQIYNILISSPELSVSVGENIFNHHLPDNFDLDYNAIVFILNKNNSIGTLDNKNELQEWTLSITVVGSDTIIVGQIVNEIETLLSVVNDENVRDIVTTTISPTIDAEKDRYLKMIDFEILYTN